MPELSVVWFRNDLRLEANPALHAAQKSGNDILCLYILDEHSHAIRQLGGASKWWLNQSLKTLADQIENLGGKLHLVHAKKTSISEVFRQLIETYDIKNVFWNRRYGKAERDVDTQVKDDLKSRSIQVESFNGNLLSEPWQVKTGDGRFYRVFTPYWKNLKANVALPSFEENSKVSYASIEGENLSDWSLHPTRPDWSKGLSETWTPGHAGAIKRLETFFDEHLIGYHENRNRPDQPSTSGLSPHLAFGEISAADIWSRTIEYMENHPDAVPDGWAFLREVGWRDFSYNLLYHADNLSSDNWNQKFDAFPWEKNESALNAWQRGETGYPIVDAGMRELWYTGYMHNRVRMIVASFLCKHLRIDWRHGERWFWDTLVDADMANHPASWQWTAGSGADAAPYFRIFNPMTQGQKFDPNGDYVAKWVPELKKLPTKYIHEPWTAPTSVLTDAGVALGQTYPEPIVDHKPAREAALAAYAAIK